MPGEGPKPPSTSRIQGSPKGVAREGRAGNGGAGCGGQAGSRQEAAAAYPRALAGLPWVSDRTASAGGVTPDGTGAGMGSGGTEDAEPRLWTCHEPPARSHVLVWGFTPSGFCSHRPGWTQPACSAGRAPLCGSMPQTLAAFGAERSQGAVFGPPARCCVGQGSWPGHYSANRLLQWDKD